MTLRKTLAGLLFAVVALFGLNLSAPTANAASGTGFDGTDPISTGCVNSGQLISERAVNTWQGENAGTVQVWYSSACGTNWVRTWTRYDEGNSNKNIERPAQNGLHAFAEHEGDLGGGWSYSMQVYAPGSTQIRVWGSIDTGGAMTGFYDFTLV